MRRISIALLIVTLICKSAAFAQTNLAPVRVSAELLAGTTDYYYAESGHFPLVSANVNVTVAAFLIFGVEATKAWTEQTPICLDSSGSCSHNLSDPHRYFGVHAQLQVPAGSIRPYVGASLGSLPTCDPKESCGTSSFEGGVRLELLKSAGLMFAARRRYDSRYPDSSWPNRHTNEYRAGLFYVIR
jgi:hypothetical protein